MRSTTLAALRTLVRARSDTDDATDRHTDAQLTSEVNQAIVELRSRLTQDGAELYQASTTGTLSTTPVTGQNYTTITAPATAEAILAIDIVDSGNLITLEETPLRQRLMGGSDTAQGEYPCGWSVIDLENRTVAIYPIPDEAYTYVIWYQTQFTDLSGDSDTWTVLPGFVDFVTWRVVEYIAVRDDLQALKNDAARMMDAAYRVALKSARGLSRADNWRKNTRGNQSRLTAVGRHRAS